MDYAAVTARQQQVWSEGDFARIGVAAIIVGELLCEAVDIHPGERVLDVASGSGNAALAAARRFGEVTASDFVPHLLETAARRAETEGLPLTTQVADAQDLPFPDGSFDVVLSTFGAMFAPDQERTAAELVRVCRPGGRIGMANWVPDGWAGDLFRATAARIPPPPGLRPATDWGGTAPGALRRPHLRAHGLPPERRAPLLLARARHRVLPDVVRSHQSRLRVAR